MATITPLRGEQLSSAMVKAVIHAGGSGAEQVDVDIPMGKQAAELSAAFDKRGHGGLDFSAIFETL